MIRFICILSFLFSIATIHAQKLNGKIHLGLEDSEGLPGVRVDITGFTTQFTDELGKFSLALPEVERGSKLELEVYKEGFVVINREALYPRVPDRDTEQMHLYLCKKANRTRLALQHYKLQVTRTIDRNYHAEAKILADNLNYEAIGELTKKKETAEKMADSLAARLARFDPASASDELTRAMQLYQEGKVTEALQVIDPNKISARIQARKEIEKDLQDANQQDIATLMKAADMALSDLKFTKALTYYETAVMADTTNFDHVSTFCSFLHRQTKSDRVIPYSRLMLRMATDSIEKRTALNYLGLGLSGQNFYEKSLEVFAQVLLIDRAQAQLNPTRFKAALGYSLSSVGEILYKLNRYPKSLEAYAESLKIFESLSNQDPERFESQLAKALSDVANVKRDLNQYPEALEFYNDALKIFRSFSDQNSAYIKVDFAYTLQELGLTYSYLNKHSESIEAYTEALDIYRNLARKNPTYIIKVISALNDLGSAYVSLKQLPKSIETYQEALKLAQPLAMQNPDRFKPQLAVQLSNLGRALTKSYQYAEAHAKYRDALVIWRSLALQSPERFEENMATTLNNIGSVNKYQRNYSAAIEAYTEAVKIRSGLAEKNPAVFGSYLGDTYVNFGNLYQKRCEIFKAISFYEKADSAYGLSPGNLNAIDGAKFAKEEIKRLSAPDGLAGAYGDQGIRLYIKKEVDSARYYSSWALKEYEIIAQEYPDDEQLKKRRVNFNYNLSLYSMLAEDFHESEKTARKVLELSPKSTAVIAYLATALLFTGQYEEAYKYYSEWKDKPWVGDASVTFGFVFLDILSDLEAKGSTHPNLEKIRKLLKE